MPCGSAIEPCVAVSVWPTLAVPVIPGAPGQLPRRWVARGLRSPPTAAGQVRRGWRRAVGSLAGPR